MVRNRPHEWSEAGKTAERVSPFCRERINVTQSWRAMSEDAHGSSNYRKFRNLNLTYENRLRQQNGHRETVAAADHEPMRAKAEELTEDTCEDRSNQLPTQPTMKKKSLHKIATGALANIGLLFAGGGSGGEDGGLTGGSKFKIAEACNDPNDPNVDFNDSGVHTKLSQKEKFFSNPWKTRQKFTTNAGSSLWTPDDNCEWTSASGLKVQLIGVDLDELSRQESIALQHISLAKLRKFHLRSNVAVPKDSHSSRKFLRRAFSLKTKASGTNDKEKDTGVFAIPLRKAVAQAAESHNEDQEKVNKSKTDKAKSDADYQKGDPVEPVRVRRHSSSSLHQTVQATVESEQKKSSPSSKVSQDSPKWKSRLIDALSLSLSSSSASCLTDKQADLDPRTPQVPLMVHKAIEHLDLYGLHILGIFRVGGSKKRMKQMREQFDSGQKTDFTAEDNPHDVAALFKEYFRDLPEPLLTRDLYSVFLESQRENAHGTASSEEDKRVQVLVLRLVCCLLPIPNRDTLKVLLDFLGKVAHFSDDTLDENGILVPGNQMTSRNLATLMGPNILHKVKGQHHDFLVEDAARAEERQEVIDVVQNMIEHRADLFQITADDHHEVLLHMFESHPKMVDSILKRKASKSKRASCEVDEVFLENGDSKENGQESRVRTVGEPERPLSRAASAPSSRPSSNTNPTPRGEKKNLRGSHSPVPPVRSHSLSQQEAILYRNRLFNRMQSPSEITGGNLGGSFHSSYRDNRRRTPPLMRAARVYRYGDTSPRETSEPPSPALSSTSWSNYSTPPSSPSGSTQYMSAESSLSHSPLEGSYFGEDTPTRARLTCILNEVGVEVSYDETSYSESKSPVDCNHFRTQDVQLERWNQWESMAQQNKTQTELEQETLV